MTWHRHIGAPVDCHVLTRDCPQWLDQALASLESEPVNIWLEEGDFGGHIGRARAHCLAQGSAPYQAWIDDDDYLLPGGHVQACIDVLDAEPGVVGAYTDLQHIDGATGQLIHTTALPAWTPLQHMRNPFEILHFKLFRREAAAQYLDEVARWATFEEAVLMGLLVNDGVWRKLDRVAYAKRKRLDGAGSRITPSLIRRGVRVYASALIARHHAGRLPHPVRQS